MEQLVVTSLRNIFGGMDLDRVLASREQISAALHGILAEAAGKWGIQVNRVDLKAIEPPASYRGPAKRRAPAEPAQPTKPAPRAELPPPHRPLHEGDPRRIDRYRLTARLGEGGMGTVYLGHSPGERLVAVKVIQRELADDPSFRQRFGREISSARKVGGFHTASVVDADPHGDPPCLVTEYIPGPSLHDVLNLPSRLVDVVSGCLHHDPATRPAPAEVIERLTRQRPSADDWLPPPVRTLIELHKSPTASSY
ncbi:SPFH domain-containing protein [Streptomyces sp. NPDC059009]|uniref:SPFH domain-containing protein n=1 Tax=Streptomyces sp. NPDC059009 TaxID=3346694 RepID=UPI003693A2C3